MPIHDVNTVDIFLPQSDRLQILSQNEFELLWGLPSFSPVVSFEWWLPNAKLDDIF